MLPFNPPARRDDRSHIAAPFTPAAYVALRREAAGYTQESFARALVILEDHHRPVPRPRLTLEEGRTRFRQMLGLVRLLERRGTVARCPQTLTAIASLIAFDAAVYRQLATQPAARHPRICRTCACSNSDPCFDHQDHVCHWVTPDLCSHCVAHSVASAQVAA